MLRFAELIGWPFDPWQQLLAIHLGELLDDGRPRFRQILIIVARQNGKTVFARVLILFWMFVQRAHTIVASHTDRGKAKKSWAETIAMAEAVKWLADDLPKVHVVKQIGEEDFFNSFDSHYFFGAANGRLGRGDTVDRGLLDELRDHANREPLSAIEGAMNAVRDAQLVMISNQGDRKGVVLKTIREAALNFILTGRGDYRLGLIEWSAPEGSRPTDLAALAMANPDLGNRIDPEALLGMAMTAEAAGGEDLDAFKIEYMCIGVELLKAAIDIEQWKALGPGEGAEAPDLAQHRRRMALMIEVGIDGQGAALSGAAMINGRVHVEIIRAWETTKEMRKELPSLVALLRPRALAWLPSGPTAAVMVELMRPAHKPVNAEGRPVRWPPPGVKMTEITSEATAVCMGFVDLVESGELSHDGHALGLAHVSNAVRQARGDAYVFARRGAGAVHALYSMAGAVHVARTLPPPPPPLSVS